MMEVEKTLGVAPKRDEFRREVIARIGAWSLDHPKSKPVYSEVFPKLFTTLREAYYEQRKKQLQRLGQALLVYVTDGQDGVSDAAERTQVAAALQTLKERYGYCEKCAKEAVSL